MPQKNNFIGLNKAFLNKKMGVWTQDAALQDAILS
jgi:hypothetical protein